MTIVDTDVHPLPVSAEVLKSYAPAGVEGQALADRQRGLARCRTSMTRRTRTRRCRCVSTPARPGAVSPGSDPDFAAKQLLVDAGVSIAVLEPMCDAQLPQAEHVLKATYNDWLADVWLGDNNWHGRWRGAISVTAQDPGRPRARSSAGPATRTWPRC